MQGIKEEGEAAVTIQRPTEDGGDTLVDNLGLKDSTEGERRQRIELAIRKRAKFSHRVCRVRRQTCYGEPKSVRPRVKITVGSWGRLLWPGVNIIRLFSCSASRYAMFKSNRSYKPGD